MLGSKEMATTSSNWADKFATISSILPEEPSTWEKTLFLTIDVDWAADTVLNETIAILEDAGVAATFFITHPTSTLERLRTNPKFELGIHPNFNPLLEGKSEAGTNAVDVISDLMNLVPEARSVRSHSMTQSSRILDLFEERGLTHDCNHFIPRNSGIVLRPYRHWNGMIRVPYCWEDDVALLYNDKLDLSASYRSRSLKVFDFHPIHISLNTTSIEQYEKTREVHRSKEQLNDYISNGWGIRSALDSLLEGWRWID
jgi:hypothetical protein